MSDRSHDRVALDCAGRERLARPLSTRLPGEWLREARIAAVACVATLVPYVLFADYIFCFSPMVGFLAGCVALGCAVAAFRSNGHPDLSPPLRIRRLRVFKWLGIAAGLLLLQTGACLNAGRSIQQLHWSSVTSANLAGIGQAIQMYLNDQHVAPGSLDDLVRANLVTPKQLVSPNDPAYIQALANGTSHAAYMQALTSGRSYSSYKFLSPPKAFVPDPAIVLAHESQPWSLHRLPLYPDWRRCVVFADGHVASLTEAEFEAAMKADAKRRK